MGLLDKGRLMAAGLSALVAKEIEDQTCAVGNSSPPSAGGISTNPNGNIFSFAGSVGNGADTTEDTLKTFALPANALDVAGRGIHVYAWGTYANNTNTKAAKLYFGSEIVTAASGNNVSWSLEMWAIKSGANTQQISGQPITGTSHGGIANQSGAEADTAAITIKVTAQDSTSATANAIVLNGMFVEFMN